MDHSPHPFILSPNADNPGARIIPLHRGPLSGPVRPQGGEDSPKLRPANLYALLKSAGYRPTLRDRIEDLIFDLRLNPGLAMLCIGGGMMLGLAAVIVPCLIIVAVQS